MWIEQGVDPYYQIDTGGEEICDGLMITEDGEPIVSEGGVRLQTEDGTCSVAQVRPCIDLTFSKNGNQSFSNAVRKYLNPIGRYSNILSWDRMGQANEFTVQIRFWGFSRFVAANATLEVF